MVAMICQRVIAPASKLGTVRAFGQSTLADELGVADADEDDLYAAMDWLLDRQSRIEDRLARRHLHDGELVLYDVSSSYFEGRCCELAKLGYSRDQKRGSRQIIYGLLCDKPGRPVAVEVFSGELHDDKTLPSQIEKLKDAVRAIQDRCRVRPRDGHQGQPRADARSGRDRLDHRAQSAADPEARPPAGAAALAAGSDQPGRDHLRGLSRRAADRVPQPARRSGARPQTHRTAGSDRARPG